jgi:AmmeMemoRadiSam system protein B
VSGPVRDAVFAGSWYPGSREAIDAFFRSPAPAPPAPQPAIAIMGPHAGWTYSGAIARETYQRVVVPETAVVLCPNHRVPPPVLAVWASGSWRTPLGETPVDETLATRLLEEARRAGVGLRADTGPHEREHAIELHLPFLQHHRPDVRIVPVVVGVDDVRELEAFGQALARAILAHDRRTLIVASSDMNHFESATVAARKDKLALAPLLALDPEGLVRAVDQHEVTMCGVRPGAAALHAARALGAKTGELVRYGHSGLVSGDHERVVAYAGVIFR